MKAILQNLDSVVRAFGRGAVYYAHDGTADVVGDPILWDGTTELNLAPLSDTEGDIVFSPNNTQATLTLPELSGDAIHDAIDLGENPTLELPLYMSDPDLLDIVAPRGVSHAGHRRICAVAYRTIVVFPEAFCQTGSDCAYGSITYSLADGWKVGGVEITEAQETLLELALWCWRVYFVRHTTTFRGQPGDEGKAIEPVTVRLTMHPGMPDGHRLYTRGDPAVAGILLEGAS